jgi:tetratricopeptide (TPR) repeat protein
VSAVATPSAPNFVRRLLLVATAILVLAWCLREDVQPDLYFHLAAGRTIWSDGLPTQNVFLAPHPDHEFVDHEWLFQAVAYPLYQLGGARLLSLLKALCVVAMCAALASAARVVPRARWILIGLAVMVAGGRFVLRPEVLSFLGVALYLWALRPQRSTEGSSGEAHPSRSILICLPIVQLLWSNCHGFSLLGPALVVVTLAARGAHAGISRWGPDAIARRLGPAPQGLRRLLLLLVLVSFASLINPYGLEAALYPFLILARTGQDAASAGLNYQVVELMSPFRPELADQPEIRIYKLWLLAGPLLWVLAFWRNREGAPRARLEDLFAGGLLCASSFAYLRNLPFAALGLVIPSALGLRALWDLVRERWSERAERGALVLLIASALIALGAARSVLDDTFHRNASYDARPGLAIAEFTAYPEAIEFWAQSPPAGEVFNNFGAGHYLIWRHQEGQPLPFICGNTDLYPRSQLVAYAEVMRGEVPPFPLLDSAKISDVFLDHRVEVPPVVIQSFVAHPDWLLVHADRRCVIFRRQAPGVAELSPAEVTRRARSWSYPSEAPDSFAPTRALRALNLLPPREPNPLHRLQVAQLLQHLGAVEAARAQTEEALRLAPRSPLAVQTLASVQEALGRPREAAHNWRELRALVPADALPHVKLGLLALRSGELQDARGHFQRALARDPGSLLARQNLLTVLELQRDAIGIRLALQAPDFPESRRLFHLGVAAELEQDWEAAVEGYGGAARADAGLTPAWARWAEVLGRLERWEEAERTWTTLCKKSPKDGSAWRALGRVRRRLKDPAGALEAWLQAAQDPREVEALLLAGALQASRGETEAAKASLGLARERAPKDPRVSKLAALIEALNED